MKRKTAYILFVALLTVVLYLMLALVRVAAHNPTAHDVALVVSTITIAMMAVYLSEHMFLRSDVILLFTLIAYWALLIPLANFTPDDWFFLSVDDMVYCQGLPIFIISLIWYGYQSVLLSLEKGEK